MPIKGVRLCGAKCRSKNGAPCLNPAMRGSERCRMHFGHSRRLITHGRLTNKACRERKQQKILLKEMREINKEIEKMNEK